MESKSTILSLFLFQYKGSFTPEFELYYSRFQIDLNAFLPEFMKKLVNIKTLKNLKLNLGEYFFPSLDHFITWLHPKRNSIKPEIFIKSFSLLSQFSQLKQLNLHLQRNFYEVLVSDLTLYNTLGRSISIYIINPKLTIPLSCIHNHVKRKLHRPCKVYSRSPSPNRSQIMLLLVPNHTPSLSYPLVIMQLLSIASI